MQVKKGLVFFFEMKTFWLQILAHQNAVGSLFYPRVI